jgi:hypothetical protein
MAVPTSRPVFERLALALAQDKHLSRLSGCVNTAQIHQSRGLIGADALADCGMDATPEPLLASQCRPRLRARSTPGVTIGSARAGGVGAVLRCKQSNRFQSLLKHARVMLNVVRYDPSGLPP